MQLRLNPTLEALSSKYDFLLMDYADLSFRYLKIAGVCG